MDIEIFRSNKAAHNFSPCNQIMTATPYFPSCMELLRGKNLPVVYCTVFHVNFAQDVLYLIHAMMLLHV
jgi:hypothetical protein